MVFMGLSLCFRFEGQSIGFVAANRRGPCAVIWLDPGELKGPLAHA
jgi:hypothetical protein